MAIRSLVGLEYSFLGLNIAAIVIITKQNKLIENLDIDLADEVQQIISKLNALPDSLGVVIAWEICGVC